jgi:hypothetical protein
MENTRDIATPQDNPAYRSQLERKPSWAGIDLDPARRPGVPWQRDPPQPFPNTRFPPERQPGEPTVPKHARPNKPLPPVFGTACPLRGVSGIVRKLAYQLPDHKPEHWMLLILGDRVDAWGHRFGKLAPFALPLAGLFFAAKILRR